MSSVDSASAQRPDWSIRISAMRGVAIVLVVLGHLRLADGPELWLAVRRVIFDVHVPLFFVISGVLWGLGSFDASRGRSARWVTRLLVPFVAFTAIPLIGLSLGRAIPGVAPHLPSVGVEQILAHLRNPQTGGFAVHLWFLVALFLVKVVHPWLRRVLRTDALVFVVALGLSLVPLPGDGCLRLAALHLPLYAAGVLLGRAGLVEHLVRPRISWAIAAAGFFAALFALPRVGPVRLALGLCGIVVIATLVARAGDPVRRGLAALGDRSLEMFLVHPLFVPVALALAAGVGDGPLSWVLWLASGLVAVAGTWALVRGIERVPGARAVLFGASTGRVSTGNLPVRSRRLGRLLS